MNTFARRSVYAVTLLLAVLATGCVTQPAQRDYTAYKEARPKSIVVLPPLNHSPEVNASAAVLSQVTLPLAEAGYYVLPVGVVDDVFKQNGLSNAADAQAASPAKLREIFGADAGLYIDVRKYGTVYSVIRSDTVVTLDARLVDLRSNQVLWSGSATASSAEQQSNSGGGVIGVLLTAVVNQIIVNVSDQSYGIAAISNQRLLSAGRPNGLLYGPRSPKYGTD